MAPATPDAAPAAPAAASSSRKTRGPFTRARTGCMTCRRRKMKCNEAKPICGPCSKSQRPCEWQEVTFRHQQNPMLNAADTSLSKFYKGTGTYTNEQLASFVRVKDNLQFAPTAIPGPSPGGGNAQPRPATATTQQMPDHTLQTLAAAAVQHPPYVPPRYEAYPTYTPAPHTGHDAQAVPNTNINSLLNPSTTPTSMIDPNLESSIDRNSTGSDERAREVLAGIRDSANSRHEDMNETDTKLAHALQGFSDGQGQSHNGTDAKS